MRRLLERVFQQPPLPLRAMFALPMRTTSSSLILSLSISLCFSISFFLSLSLSLSLSPLAAPLAVCVFCDFKSTQLSRKNLCFLMKESELAARGGTRKPFQRATRQRRPMDVHVFVSLRLRLGFGHQGNPNFTFGKPHDQKIFKNRPPLSNANLFLLRRFICFLIKRKKVLNPQLAARRRFFLALLGDPCKP